MSATGVNPDGTVRTRTDQLARAVFQWPTPHGMGENDEIALAETADGGNETRQTRPPGLNPVWVSWLMGFPIGWTSIEPLSADRFRAWRRMFGTGESNLQPSETHRYPHVSQPHGGCSSEKQG